MDVRSVVKLCTIKERQRALLDWYRKHGRHHLPWRRTRNPYAILVSEIMLQQTQVDRVIPYWEAWMRRWPTVDTLARARRASVIRAWAGLGYNRRAVALHRMVQEVMHNGWPTACAPGLPAHAPGPTDGGVGQIRRRPYKDLSHVLRRRDGWDVVACVRELQRLPGVGPYTANALLAFAWNQPAPCVDTNIRRVLAYVIYRQPRIMDLSIREVMRLAARVIPNGHGRDWNYALMDYGALVLTARHIPQRGTKRPSVPFRGSTRFWRGRIVAALRSTRRPLTRVQLIRTLSVYGDPCVILDDLLDALERDGVIAERGSAYTLA